MSSAEGRRYIRTPEFGSLKDHVYNCVGRYSGHGVTTQEAVQAVNRETPPTFITYSNPVSGALSRLHNVDRKIVRLHERRRGFYVYVLPEYINGRDYFPPRRPNQPDDVDLDHEHAQAIRDAAAGLEAEHDAMLIGVDVACRWLTAYADRIEKGNAA
jgi:hypothetical protein